MSENTHGLRLRSGSTALRAGVELLSSMRFAISLLTVICIASVIGTVMRQHEPLANYVNEFGPFWAELFLLSGLNAVYSAWWFLLILAFLVISTSLCIARNTPKILTDLKVYKENIREQSLKAFHHKAEADLQESSEAEARRIGTLRIPSALPAVCGPDTPRSSPLAGSSAHDSLAAVHGKRAVLAVVHIAQTPQGVHVVGKRQQARRLARNGTKGLTDPRRARDLAMLPSARTVAIWVS